MENQMTEKQQKAIETVAKIERGILTYLSLKDSLADVRLQMQQELSDVMDLMTEAGMSVHDFNYNEEKLALVTVSDKEKKRLNKSTLAEELDVERSELDTTGMIELANEKVLTRDHLNRNTEVTHVTAIKVKLKKIKQKKKKSSEE